jgi:uroporphyrinogen-III decarboxylase
MKKNPLIQDLLDTVEELHNHPRNQANNKKWEPLGLRTRDKWRGVPKPVQSTSETPIVVNLEQSLLSDIFHYSVRDYFTDPQIYLEYYLKAQIFRFEQIQDDVPILLHVPAFRNIVFESALFGSPAIYADDRDPWIAREPVITDLTRVDELPIPDFETAPGMPLARQAYEFILEQVEGRPFSVSFVEWIRGPLGVAMYLYGMQEFLIALGENPSGAQKLLERVTDSRLEWERRRALYLGEQNPLTAAIFNDEVNTPTLSPRQYQTIVLPFEQQIREVHHGIHYFHSCGNTTKMLPHIATLKPTLFHVGPWTDAQLSAQAMSPQGSALELCVHAVDDVFESSPEQMEKRIRERIGNALSGGAIAYSLEAAALDRMNGAEKDLAAVQSWVEVARRTLSNFD